MGFALDARRRNINGQIDIKYQNIIDNSTFTVTTIGGNADDALAFISSGQSGDFFEENPDITTAVPISYTLRQLGGDFQIAKISETTDYNITQYDSIPVNTYFDEGTWRSAVQSIMSYQKWECNWPNVLKADEHGSFFDDPNSSQWFLGKKITFNAVNTGYPFNFELEAMDGAIPPGEMKALVFNDNEGGASWNEAISIGDIDDYDNDDFEIRVSGSAKVYAIAFIMLSNTTGDMEYLQVFAEDLNNTECEIEYVSDPINGFFGVISPVPIKRIWFDEREGGDDDIALGDLFFGYK
jgi:hypothetical protein